MEEGMKNTLRKWVFLKTKKVNWTACVRGTQEFSDVSILCTSNFRVLQGVGNGIQFEPTSEDGNNDCHEGRRIAPVRRNDFELNLT